MAERAERLCEIVSEKDVENDFVTLFSKKMWKMRYVAWRQKRQQVLME